MALHRDDTAVTAIRAFNRFYTRLLGLLEETLLDSPVSLTEARILWEIRHRPRCLAEGLVGSLGVDRGHLSRILRRLERQSLVSRSAHASDRRVRLLALTAHGDAFMRRLEEQASRQIRELIRGLGPGKRARLVGAMREIQSLLSSPRLRGREEGHMMG